MKEIWIYVEGGGGKDSKDQLRQAFSRFLTDPRVAARPEIPQGTGLREP